jgi:hypothetical protein
MAIGFPVKDDYVTGDVLTAANMNDLSGTLNTIQSVEYAAGKNKIINGDFRVWQRGTTFTSPATNSYTADRWLTNQDGSGTVTVSQQSFTPGTAPVAGYEAPFFLRQAVTAAGTTSFFQMQQKIEDVRTFANQTVTFSFWAKADSSRTGLVYWEQNFGSGGSATVQSTVFPAPALTTSWQRFTYTFTLPSISGKTIGTGSFLIFYIRNGGTALGANLDIWGAQLEASSTASDFQTATGTLQGELAACQRYYYRSSSTNAYGAVSSSGYTTATTNANILINLPVAMRVAPTSVDFSTLQIGDVTNTYYTVSGMALNVSTTTTIAACDTTSSGMTTSRWAYLRANNSTSGYVGLSAEL